MAEARTQPSTSRRAASVQASDISIRRRAAAGFSGSADDFVSNCWRSAAKSSGIGSVSMCAKYDDSPGAMALMTG
jgi:hypothetical protein